MRRKKAASAKPRGTPVGVPAGVGGGTGVGDGMSPSHKTATPLAVFRGVMGQLPGHVALQVSVGHVTVESVLATGASAL